MIVNSLDRWVYIAPPKTASTSLHEYFWRSDLWPPENEIMMRQHEMVPPEGCETWFTFASIRNPFARAASLWRHRLSSLHRCDHLSVAMDGDRLLPFEEFMRRVVRGIEGDPFFTRTQWSFLAEAHHVDAFIRVESLASDMQRLPFIQAHRLPIDPYPPRLHVTQHLVPTHFTPNTMDMIREWADLDFEHLGYSREMEATDGGTSAMADGTTGVG